MMPSRSHPRSLTKCGEKSSTRKNRGACGFRRNLRDRGAGGTWDGRSLLALDTHSGLPHSAEDTAEVSRGKLCNVTCENYIIGKKA